MPLLRDVMTAILVRFEWHDDVRSQKRARLLYRPLRAANHRSVQQGLRTEDISAVIDYLTTLPYVDSDSIGAMGICAGGGYTANAAINPSPLRAHWLVW